PARAAARRDPRQALGGPVRDLARAPGGGRRDRGPLSQPERRHVVGNGPAAGGRPSPALAGPLRAAAAPALARGPGRARRLAEGSAVAARAPDALGAAHRIDPAVAGLGEALGRVESVLSGRSGRRPGGGVPIRGRL